MDKKYFENVLNLDTMFTSEEAASEDLAEGESVTVAEDEEALWSG